MSQKSNSNNSSFSEEDDQSVEFYEIEEKTYKQILFLDDVPIKEDTNLKLIYKSYGKIYRYREGEWKERGEGYFKILYYIKENKVLFVFYQDKVYKIRSKFYIPYNTEFDSTENIDEDNEEESNQTSILKIRKYNNENDKIVFSVLDYSDNEEEPVFDRIRLEFHNESELELFKINVDIGKSFIFDGNMNSKCSLSYEKVGFE